MPSLNSKYSMALFCIKYSGLIHLDFDLNLMLSMKLYNFKLLSYPRRLCSMKRSTAIYSFFSNSVPAVMDVYFIPSSKKMTFQRPSQSLKLIIQEWWGAFQTDTIWHIAFHFWTFQRISIEWIDNKVNLPNSKVNPNSNWFSLVVFHFSVYICTPNQCTLWSATNSYIFINSR